MLEEVEDWVNVFLHLPLPYSLMERIESSENTTPKQALAEIVVRLNPAIDWERLAKALSDAGYRALAEDVTTKYVKGETSHTNNCLLALKLKGVMLLLLQSCMVSLRFTYCAYLCTESFMNFESVCEYCVCGNKLANSPTW